MFRCVLALAAAGLAFAGPARAQSLTSRLGTMSVEQITDGCGCSFEVKGGKGRLSKGYVFSSDLEGKEASGLMVIDGAKLTLRQMRGDYNDGKLKRGVRWSALYASPDGKLRVGVETTIVRDCEGRGEDCEAYDHEGALTLTEGAGRSERLAIKGVCGC